MPYEVRQKGEEWCVFNKDTEEEKACHATKELADRQVNLLRGLEHGMISNKEQNA